MRTRKYTTELMAELIKTATLDDLQLLIETIRREKQSYELTEYGKMQVLITQRLLRLSNSYWQ
jgi:hypothetical protein